MMNRRKERGANLLQLQPVVYYMVDERLRFAWKLEKKRSNTITMEVGYQVQ